jgi:hypothetical protein
MPKMDDFAIYSPFPSISGYQSGLGTDTKSMDSVYCMAQSLGLTQNSVQEFISCFGNTLIEKSGARKWARHTLATYTQEDIEKRLDMLLHGYTIKFASEFLHSGASNGSDRKLPAVSKQTYQVLSDATILIRHCRPTSLGTSPRTLSQGRITQYLYDSSGKARPTAIALWTIWASHEIQCGRFGTRECRPNLSASPKTVDEDEVKLFIDIESLRDMLVYSRFSMRWLQSFARCSTTVKCEIWRASNPT